MVSEDRGKGARQGLTRGLGARGTAAGGRAGWVVGQGRVGEDGDRDVAAMGLVTVRQ